HHMIDRFIGSPLLLLTVSSSLLFAGAVVSVLVFVVLELLLLPPSLLLQAVMTSINASNKATKPVYILRFIPFSPFQCSSSSAFQACSCNPLDKVFLCEEKYKRRR